MIILCASCTKEVINLGEQNRIESYVVETAEGNLYGAIDQTTNTITVYLPFYYDFPAIDPILKLSPYARLAEDYDAIPVDSIGHKYTVIGADNSTRTYSLIIETTIPRPLWVDLTGTPYIGNNANIIGNFIVKDYKSLKGFVIDESNKEYPFLESPYGESAFSITPMGNATYHVSGYLFPKNLQENTNYKVRIYYAGEIFESEDWFTMSYHQVAFDNRQPYKDTKAGQNFTAKVMVGAMLPPKRVFTQINGEEVNIPIVSYDYDHIVIKIPDNIPLGIDYNVRVEFDREDIWDAQIIFNVTE